METFTTQYGTFTAYINPLTQDGKDIYHLSFIDKENKVQIVRMQLERDKCSFLDPAELPSWVVGLEQQLSDLVIKQALLQYQS